MDRNNLHTTLGDDLATDRERSAEPLLRKAERLKAALSDTVDEQMHVARRAARRTQHAAEDLADDLRLRTRREPLKSLGMALGIGALIGLMFGWRSRSRRRRDTA
jgi:ElaB/YqjD/DUF883 family membrane-anchored ribosome-binding protein